LERVPLARRAARLSATLAATDHGDAIPFDSGHGFPGIFPDLTSAAEIALTQYRAETLQYAPRPGLREMREWIASYMAEEGALVAPDDVLVVNGAKHGLELLCRVLLDPGDAIVVTAPMYFTAIPLFRSFDPEFIEIGQDEEGLDTDELAEALARWRREGRPTPKFIYNVPEFHNPTGLTMSRRRREALLDIARRYGTWVVEDSPYRAIRFEGTADPTLLALDRSASVIHVGTFSKLLAPGIRVGWVVAPPEILSRMIQLKADGGSSPLLQRIVLEWLKSGGLPPHSERARATYRSHRDRMLAALRREMPEVKTTLPQGGYYVWLTLPGDVDADAFAKEAAHSGVTIIPGSKFYASSGPSYPHNQGPPKNCVRLTYSFADEPQIDEGIRRLAEVLRTMRR
jgi:2-aminoadipate transaminase